MIVWFNIGKKLIEEWVEIEREIQRQEMNKVCLNVG